MTEHPHPAQGELAAIFAALAECSPTFELSNTIVELSKRLEKAERRAERWKEAARHYRSTAKENADALQRAYSELWDAEEELSLLKVPE